jgi:inorganic pyrophosphatase
MAPDLLALPPRDDSGALHVVVESPRGSRTKLKYAPKLRTLVLGVTYPYDWGFVPGTRAPDGDPVDAMIVSDVGTFPGVVVCCRPLAVLQIEQNAKQGGGRVRNDRIVAEPDGVRRASGDLATSVREELEAFFVSATLFEGKDVRLLGWADAAAAEALVDRASR